jgi:hypothetical protein
VYNDKVTQIWLGNNLSDKAIRNLGTKKKTVATSTADLSEIANVIKGLK